MKELEERGVGRPSTYSAIISSIQERGYVIKHEKRFIPTEIGETVGGRVPDLDAHGIEVCLAGATEFRSDRRRIGHLAELRVVEPGVCASLGQQCAVTPLLNDPARFHDQDDVRVANS